MLLLTGKVNDSSAAGFNKLFCFNFCNRATWHFKTGNSPAHCTEHSIWPNLNALKRVQAMLEPITCENCSQQFEKRFTRVFNGQTVCPLCFTLITTNVIHPNDMGATPEELELRRINDAGEITQRELYFISETKSLDSLTGTIPEKYEQLKSILEGHQQKIFEHNTRQEIVYRRMLEYKRQMTNEEREKLKLTNIEYNPGALNPSNVKPAVAKKPRQSAQEKTAEKLAMITCGGKITRGNLLAAQLFKEHPEYYSNGVPKAEYVDTVNNYIKEHGGLTMEQAIEQTKEMLRANKNKEITDIATGKTHLDGTPIEKKEQN